MSLENQIIEILKAQQEVFGDELYTKVDFKEETPPAESNRQQYNYSPNSPINVQEKTEEVNLKINISNVSSLGELEKKICECNLCPLGKTRNKFVYGEGNPNAKLVFIGEGPGADEDAQGRPFVGRAGKLLTDIIEKGMLIKREDVYICNIVKCRPPGNRVPTSDEMADCIPYLKKQLELIKPGYIICLGLTAASGLLGLKDTLGNLRGKVYDFQGSKVVVTYHPAALLRNPNWKVNCWEDIKLMKNLMGLNG